MESFSDKMKSIPSDKANSLENENNPPLEEIERLKKIIKIEREEEKTGRGPIKQHLDPFKIHLPIGKSLNS